MPKLAAFTKSSAGAAKAVSEGSCCGLTQGILASLITGGHLARHVRKMQQVYGHRRQVLMESLHRDLSRWLEPIPSAAGLHIAAALKVPLGDKAIEATALRQRIGVRALSAFSSRRASPTGLAFGFGAINDSDIVEGLVALSRVLASATHKS